MCIRDRDHIVADIIDRHFPVQGTDVTYRQRLSVSECITDPVSYTHLDVYKRQCMSNLQKAVAVSST